MLSTWNWSIVSQRTWYCCWTHFISFNEWTAFVDDAKIEILEKYKDEPYTLAHELGHYMAIKQRQDNSESGADIEADKLCRLILNKKEQELLSISLKCYFHNTEVAT